MNNFMPKLFISIGATNAFYTLRETYLSERFIGDKMIREIRSHHHFNLSQDLDAAIAKAQEDAVRMGLPFEFSREKLEQEMRDITRATAEELEAREKARLADIKYYEEMRADRKLEQEGKILNGEVSFGHYFGQQIAELPRDYLTWLVKKLSDFEEGSLMRLLAEVVRDKHSDKLLPEPDKTSTVGKIGERVTLDVEVLRNYPVQTDYGTLYIITMVSAERVCIVSKSTSFYAKVGEKLHIKATVKSHDEYKGQAQTRIQRIKVLDQVEKKAA
jgi:uncharacterized protein (DUF3820 family)